MTGPPSVVDAEGDPVPGLGPGKTLALLCYLARERGATRDEVTHLLWGSLEEERARNAFRQALHRLRRSLGDEAIPHDRERVHLEPAGLLEVDVDAFEDALDRGHVEEALEHWSGDFLEGLDTGELAFEHWADRERARLRARAGEALARAAHDALNEGDPERALVWARRRAEHAPYDEEAALTEAEVLVALGRRAEARACLSRFARRLEAELDAQPSGSILEAIERLDAEAAVARPAAHDENGAASETERDRSAADDSAVERAALARLLGAWRSLREGTGSTVLIEGPPDARRELAEEFLARVRALGPVLTLRGSERVTGGEGLPYAPVADALRGTLDAPGLAGANSRLLAEASRLVPQLREHFDLPDHGPVDEEAARHRLFEGAAELVDAVAYEQPVCLVLDGVDRSAPATRELVQYLAGRLRASRVLLLLLVERATPEWMDGRSDRERIVLEGAARRTAMEGDEGAAPEGRDPARGSRTDVPPGGPASGPAVPRTSRWRRWRSALAWGVGVALALITLALLLSWPGVRPTAGGHVLRDTVVLVQPRGGEAGVWAASGPLQTASERLTRAVPGTAPERPAGTPAFPWMNPNPAPTGGHVAIEWMASDGPDLYVVRGGRGDTVPVAVGPGDQIFLDWSPDGRRLLVMHGRQRPGGSYETELLVHPVDDPGSPVAIDTLGAHTVSQGVFSPDGRSVAWTARTGGRGLREIFVASADGGPARDVSAHPADDFGPVWSPDGERIAFVSTRDGNYEIYTVVLETGEVWRLTWDEARDGEPAFSPDGEFLAFESNREGVRGVWVVSSWGGEPVRVSRPREPSALAGWRESAGD